MELRELFEVKRIVVPGPKYGWISTDVNLRRGMPVRVDGFGSINFCNTLGQEWWFTPDGEAGKAARQGSLGYGVPEVRHAMLIGRIGHTVFPISSSRTFQASEDGTLAVAHSDTQQVNDNEGEWDVRVSIPVTGINSRVGPPGPQGRGAEIQFNLPWGINGSAHINLPSWVQSPRPRFSFHKAPTHGFDPQHGVFCTEVELPIPLWKARVCVHITLT